MMAKRPISYAVLRGEVIEQDWIEHGGRRGGAQFTVRLPCNQL
mgnify:CR=1 FL=1